MIKENTPPVPVYTAKDFSSDQDIKWCPGCGDYSILKQVQAVMPELGIAREDIVFVSGIGCSSRFPYYMNTYGMHSIHGRAPAVATGLKMANPKLSVWLITGDGDGLSIGAGHLMHLFRRNVDINVLLFNNEIYGLTKGQYSPTSAVGTETKSTPRGSIDYPFNPTTLALGAGATMVSRVSDRDPKQMKRVFLEAAKHKGTSFVEVYQNCIIFNDKVFDPFTNPKTKQDNTVELQNNAPIIFGKEKDKTLDFNSTGPEVRVFSEENKPTLYSTSNKYHAFAAADMFGQTEGLPRPFGVLYQEERVTYESQFDPTPAKASSIDALIKGATTWKM